MKLNRIETFIVGIAIGVVLMLMIITLASCQPPKQKDCTIILKSGTTEISVPCKDSIFYTEFEYEIINK